MPKAAASLSQMALTDVVDTGERAIEHTIAAG
jgi:hypothetical protein